MTYIDYLNRFNRWLDSNTLSSSAQLLYFKMLDVFNRANWPEYVQIDNRRLTLLADVYSEKSAIKARNELVEVGWIAYEQGKKGNPGKYSLSTNTVNIHCNKYSEIITGNENSTIDSENDSKSLIYNNINNKTLEKKKTKSIYDGDFGKVYSYFSDKIDPIASQAKIDILHSWYEKMDAGCCIKAIDIAIKNGVTTVEYIGGILNNVYQHGIRSIAEWEKAGAEMKNKRSAQKQSERVEDKIPKQKLEWFDEIWKLYPRKEKRKAALEEWGIISNLDEVLFEAIKEAIMDRTRKDQWGDSRYIPYLPVWLHEERWTDELGDDDDGYPEL